MKNIIGEKASTKLTGRLKRTFEFVDLKDIKNKSILDIGCGYGWFELNAFKKGAKKIVGAEISEADLETVKKHIKNKKFVPLIGHATKLKQKDMSFDTIVAWEVIEHIPKDDEGKFFREVHRLLKNGGCFYLSTPHDSIVSTTLDPAFWLAGHRHYSQKVLSMYGIKNGFTVEKCNITGGMWTSLSIINMYVSKWIFRREPFIKDFFMQKENAEYQRNGFYNIFVKFKKIDKRRMARQK